MKGLPVDVGHGVKAKISKWRKKVLRLNGRRTKDNLRRIADWGAVLQRIDDDIKPQ